MKAADFFKSKQAHLNPKELERLLLLDKQNSELLHRVDSLEHENLQLREKTRRRKVKKALAKKHFAEDRTLIDFLRSQTGHVDLSEFSFACPFEEEAKEEFQLESLNLSSLNQDQTALFMTFAERLNLF